MNIEKDFTNQILKLKPDYEGKVITTLVSSNFNTENRKSILYIHGYIDYFFQTHIAEKAHTNNFDFYALDLRKYGRSLLTHQHPNYCKNVNEYYEEIDIAIRKLKDKSTKVYMLAHSTGGLISSTYLNSGNERNYINGLILNSPFLDLNFPNFKKQAIKIISGMVSKISNYAKVDGVLSEIYAKSIHKDYYGEWDFNLNWKPIQGFPTYFKWLKAIIYAQKKLQHSNIKIPVLVMHSSSSKKMQKFSEEAMKNDIVLNVNDIKIVGKKLGEKVTLLEIENAMHDIFLSQKQVQETAFKEMFSWLASF